MGSLGGPVLVAAVMAHDDVLQPELEFLGELLVEQQLDLCWTISLSISTPWTRWPTS